MLKSSEGLAALAMNYLFGGLVLQELNCQCSICCLVFSRVIFLTCHILCFFPLYICMYVVMGVCVLRKLLIVDTGCLSL